MEGIIDLDKVNFNDIGGGVINVPLNDGDSGRPKFARVEAYSESEGMSRMNEGANKAASCSSWMEMHTEDNWHYYIVCGPVDCAMEMAVSLADEYRKNYKVTKKDLYRAQDLEIDGLIDYEKEPTGGVLEL